MPFAILLVRKEPHYRRNAFVEGLRRMGYNVVLTDRMMGRDRPITVPESRDDLLVSWNVKAGYDERDCQLFEKRGGTVLAVENAYLQKVDKTRYAISVHGHCGAGWFPHDPSIDRFTALEYPLRPWRENGKHVLVCGQRGIGSSEMRSPARWMSPDVVKGQHLKKFAPRELRFRRHPSNTIAKTPLERDLENAWACAVWSSSAGVRALTLGVPVTHEAPHWICQDVSHDQRTIVKPDFYKPFFTYDQVRASLNRMAWGQWSVAEIESGEPFARMKAENWGEETWA